MNRYYVTLVVLAVSQIAIIMSSLQSLEALVEHVYARGRCFETVNRALEKTNDPDEKMVLIDSARPTYSRADRDLAIIYSKQILVCVLTIAISVIAMRKRISGHNSTLEVDPKTIDGGSP
ncbi:MAG: hypothetical protein J0M04_16635 [Verrucomicrobia bacterium]|nr:hypothetical protein [Verrucomicrobiota bacterium]